VSPLVPFVSGAAAGEEDGGAAPVLDRFFTIFFTFFAPPRFDPVRLPIPLVRASLFLFLVELVDEAAPPREESEEPPLSALPRSFDTAFAPPFLPILPLRIPPPRDGRDVATSSANKNLSLFLSSAPVRKLPSQSLLRHPAFTASPAAGHILASVIDVAAIATAMIAVVRSREDMDIGDENVIFPSLGSPLEVPLVLLSFVFCFSCL